MTLLPPNARPLERALEAAAERISDVPVPLRTLWNPDTCPEALLPYLAWALSVDNWNADWPVAVRRAQVRQAVAIQRQKGTVGGIRAVVRSFGGEIALREWWQASPPSDPHTFSLVLSLQGQDGGAPPAAYVDEVIGAVQRAKPVRSHFTFTQALSAAGGVGLIGRARPVAYARLVCAA